MNLSDVIGFIEHFMNLKLVEINKTTITPSSILMFLIVIAAFAVTSRLLQRVLRTQIFSRTRIDEGIQYTLTRISHYVIMIIGAVVAFQFIGIDLTGLAIILGFLSVGIGFGLQNITSNFVAGLILLLERPIKVGDRVMVGDQEGDVVEIKMRSTTIRTLNNIAVIVPNSDFVSSKLENWSYGDQRVLLDIDVGVSYGSDLETVMRSLREVAEEHPEVLKSPAPDVLHRGFGDSAWNMRLSVWLEHPRRHVQARSDINCAIVRKFQQNGVEIPFPQRDLHLRSPLPVPITPGTEFLRSA
ncbi:MAG TPA: mechanosensitive ion channel domain-containing protein [Candidatus Binatia bacterium]|jgi:small-conductance mechanosensitive channel|nr:mechanosensitive ion channel domain-containing protein [Candidatus Binatia bacterium]